MSYKTLAMVAAAGVLGLARPAAAQVSANVSAASAEELRGIAMSDHANINPGAGVSYRACNANGFVSYDLQDRKITMIGGGLGCTVAGIDVSATKYSFSDGSGSYDLAVSKQLPGRHAPRLTLVRNFGDWTNGWYLAAEKGMKAHLGPVPLELKAVLAHNRHHYTTDNITYAEAGAHVPFSVGPVSFSPGVHYGRNLQGEGDLLASIGASVKIK